MRNKNVSFKNESKIILVPYLEINNIFDIDEFDIVLLEKFDFGKFLEFKDIIKKINSKNEINFKSKKINSNLINELNLKLNFAYGRLNYIKKFYISQNLFQCKGDINFLEEFPILFFNCSIESNDKQKLLKIFSIKTKEKKGILNLNFDGNINVISKKINFKNITMNENYRASQEDLRYFKETFEKIFFDKNLREIFNLKKIKQFIFEIS